MSDNALRPRGGVVPVSSILTAMGTRARHTFLRALRFAGCHVQGLLGSRKIQQQECRFEESLDAFLLRSRASSAQRFVIIFAGTHEIKETFGNRPMRQARVLAEQGIPVLYAYFRWHRALGMAPSPHPLIFQSPMDLTLRFMDKIIRFDFGHKQRIFDISLPHKPLTLYLPALRALGWRTLYDVRDDWEAFAQFGMAKWFDKEAERCLVDQVDACCCVAFPLRDKMQQYTFKTVHLIPNAYDTHFLSPANRGRIAPRRGRKVAGYFGHLAPAWFDWQALNEVAARQPDWTFEIIGRAGEGHPPLRKNITLSGPKPHGELNAATVEWRTALIPFKMGPLADGVDPIKIYEYLALGLPTVSFLMPQIHAYPYVFPCDSAAEFATRLEEASTQALDRNVIDTFLENNTWEIRVGEMLDLLTPDGEK